eukprot:153962_1
MSAHSAATLSTFLSTNKFPQDWNNAAYGGILIGNAAILYLIMYGRVCGISGIIGRVLDHAFSFGRNKKQNAQLIQFGFVLGLFISSILWLQPSKNTTNPLLMLLAGLLVGFGTRYGCGCTSGHGICGLARKSMRSVVAVSCFLLSAIITATFMNKYFNYLYKSGPLFVKHENDYGKYIHWIFIILIIGILFERNSHLNVYALLETLSSIIIGIIFGYGLVLSGMVQPSKVINFLNINPFNFANHWDPSLIFVLCFGLMISVTLYPLILKYLDEPICDKTGFHMPTNTVIDKRLIIGACIFGIGWGIGGVCPGPAIIVMMSTYNTYDPFWMWVLGLIIGMRIFHPILRILYQKKTK